MKTLKTIGQFIKVNINEIFTYIGGALGGGALGILIAVIIAMTLNNSEKVGYIAIGTIFALGLTAIVLIFFQALSGQADFYVTVSMNKARMPYLLGRYILLLIDIFAAFATCLVIQVLETKVIGPAIAKGREVESLLKDLSPAVLAGISLVLPLAIIFCTAMYVLFERKFFWVMWGLYMIVAIGGPRISSAMKKNPGSIPARIGEGLSAFANMGTIPWIVLGAVLVAVFLTADIMLYKKMEVKM
ncbi:MAG: hypothetical protein IKR39_03515 [Lachnospiraceae bacterium]|nr:hypothetical protein [Lachnospiraceae bacterium]